MKGFKSMAILVLFTAMTLTVGYGPAFAGSSPDDVYENEIDKNTEMSAEDIKGQDIEAFVAAANEVSEIRADYAEKIRDAENSDYEDLRKEAVEKMVEAIEDQDLDEKTYRGIAYHVKEDKDLLSKIN
ncbi:MAG: DUF4168 domain-containing protein [Desulfosalsimonas sp.]|uniref:DUF4168 domain-containing protein n=1 Tax=Desulfosalsimonas sp. TaxID=3073848 RepID=UPI003970E6A2